jgi:hypothetical protein
MPTQWKDDLHPPPTVKVLRSKGPNAGRVQTVPLWDYVGVVLRAEYSTGQMKFYPWMHVGALTVKQYAWYYTMKWRGGRTTYAPDPNFPEQTVTVCFDVKDTTADQIYKPKEQWPDGTWFNGNTPTMANLQAMRQTWHMSLRKWQVTENKSRLFLTGYRSGMNRPCGWDSTGFKIFQKSLRDCGKKLLTFEETLREYFEPNMLWVDNRQHDVAGDGGEWWGDLGLLSSGGGNATARLYEGASGSFTTGAVKQFNGVGNVLGYGLGNVDYVSQNGEPDSKMLADLVMLVNDGAFKIKVAKANGTSFDDPVEFAAPGGTTNSSRMFVADYDGDLLSDVGVLSDNGNGTATLKVMVRNPTGGFVDAASWWTGAFDMSDFATAADVNGDEKSDLVTRNAAGAFLAAVSRASCSNLSAVGLCPEGAIGAAGLGNMNVWLANTGPVGANAKVVVGDYDRDGREDLIATVNASNFNVYGLRAKSDGTFADPAQLYSGGSYTEVMPFALDVNPDGMVDLALMTRNGSGNASLQWLRTAERSTSPAVMAPAGGQPLDTGLSWGGTGEPF